MMSAAGKKKSKRDKHEVHPVKNYRISQFFAIRSISTLSISPNGKTIAYITNTNGLPNIWTIPIEGGWTSQITLQENAVTSLYYSPKKNIIVFQSDLQGDENFQLYLVPDTGGETEYITPSHIGSQVQFCTWNKKGTKILFSSNKRDKRVFDTYVYDLESKTEDCIFESNDVYPMVAAAWSKDEKYILYQKFYNNSDQDVLLYNLAKKKMENITEHKGSMKNFGGYFSKKGDSVYFLSDYEREFEGLAHYKVKSGKIGWTKLEKWDITNYSFSSSEKYLLYSINENGTARLKLENLKSKKTKTLKLPKGNCIYFDFTPDEKNIVLIFDSAQNPNDIYVYDIKKEKFKQITFSMIGGIPRTDFVIPHEIKYKSFDDLEISGYMYIPKGMKKDGTNPAIVWPHGGPEWQEKSCSISSSRSWPITGML